MIDRIDHIVMNCRDVEATASWYERALGFEREAYQSPAEAGQRIALKFGRQKFNLRPTGSPGSTSAPAATRWCARRVENACRMWAAEVIMAQAGDACCRRSEPICAPGSPGASSGRCRDGSASNPWKHLHSLYG